MQKKLYYSNINIQKALQMKNNILLVIYLLLSTLSISAMNKTIMVQNCTKSSVIFSYKRHDLINKKITYVNDISIIPNDITTIALPRATQGYSFYTYYLNIPHAVPEKVTFKIEPNEKIKPENTITITETDTNYTITNYNLHERTRLLNTLHKKEIPIIIPFPYNNDSHYSKIKITNRLLDRIKLKYSTYHNSRKIGAYIQYLYTNDFCFIDQDVKLIIPIIFQKIYLKRERTNDEFFIQLSDNKNCIEIINKNNDIITSLPLKNAIFNIDMQKIESQ